MKILSNTLFISASVVLITGAFFKIMHYPGSAMIMMIGYLGAALAFVLMFLTRKKTKAS